MTETGVAEGSRTLTGPGAGFRSASPNPQVEAVHIHQVTGTSCTGADDLLAVEEPLEIQLLFGEAAERRRQPISVTMRTPGHDAELAVGFLVTEGVIRDPDDVVEVRQGTSSSEDAKAGAAVANTVLVELAPGVPVSPGTLKRNFYTTTSCGICGKRSLLALRAVCPPRRLNQLHVAAELLHTLPRKLRSAQKTFASTGGLHGVGLFSHMGDLLAVREDVGRHNALDKLLGAHFLREATPLSQHILLLSGRASFELLQKSVMGGIACVAAVGAPSSLAVSIAQEFDVTLIGFLRDGRFNIYHGAERVTGTVNGAASISGIGEKIEP